MRVVYHALKLDEGPYHTLGGNYFHAHYLAAALVDRGDLDMTILCDEHTREPLQADIPARFLKLCELRGRGVLAADKAVVQSLRQIKHDVYHRPTGQLPLMPLAGKTVATIADLHHFLVFPMRWAQKMYKHISYRWTVRRATQLTCISRYTRDEVVRHLRADARKITVIHHGANPLPPPLFQVAHQIDSNYWLAFGHQPYKNVEAAVQALIQRPPPEHLVVIGRGAYIETVIKPLARSPGLSDRVHFPGYISREELHGLLLKSLGLLFLSTYEGFGLPVLEAMLAGCPVISSNACSLPEVVGAAAQLVSPHDVPGILRAMQRLVEDDQFRIHQARAGREQAAEFTWKQAAEKTVSVYRRALENN